MTCYRLPLAILLGLLLVSCQSSKKTSATSGLPVSSTPGGLNAVVPNSLPLTVSKGAQSLVARATTSLGENFSPHFSADGTRLLFLSRGRTSHRQAQVYEIDLVRMTERRLTFHDGDDAGPAWTASGKFIYSSSTDELKEEAYAIGKLRAQYGSGAAAPKIDFTRASDLYLQRTDGRDIERLTQSPGYDGQPSPDPSGVWRVAFVSDREGPRAVHLLERRGVRRFSPLKVNDESPHFSLDGRDLAWVRRAADGTSQIMTAPITDPGKAVALTAPGHRDLEPVFSAKGDTILFVSNRGSGAVLNLFTVDRKGCIKQVSDVDSDVREPDWSPSGDRIAFVTPAAGLRQIFVMDAKLEGIPCLPGTGSAIK